MLGPNGFVARIQSCTLLPPSTNRQITTLGSNDWFSLVEAMPTCKVCTKHTAFYIVPTPFIFYCLDTLCLYIHSMKVIKALNARARPENLHVTLIDLQSSAFYSGMVPGCVAKLYTLDQGNLPLSVLQSHIMEKFYLIHPRLYESIHSSFPTSTNRFAFLGQLGRNRLPTRQSGGHHTAHYELDVRQPTEATARGTNGSSQYRQHTRCSL